MNTTLPTRPRVRRMKPLSRLATIPHIHSPAKIKPRLLLLCRRVLRAAAIVPLSYFRVDERHGAQGIGTECDPGTNLGECGRGFVDPDFYIGVGVRVVEEADGEAEAADAAATDGDFDGLGHGKDRDLKQKQGEAVKVAVVYTELKRGE